MLSSLSQQASVGVRPDLLDLMRVPTMTAPRARALHDIGITSAESLAAAPLDLVEKAVSAALPRNLRRQKKTRRTDDRQDADCGQMGARALVVRAGKRLIESACGMLVGDACRVAEEAKSALEELGDLVGTPLGRGWEAHRRWELKRQEATEWQQTVRFRCIY